LFTENMHTQRNNFAQMTLRKARRSPESIKIERISAK